jgi:hypothetical protein
VTLLRRCRALSYVPLMEKSNLPWGPPLGAEHALCETAVFRVSKPSFSRERSYDRTVLRLSAAGARVLPDAAVELGSIYAMLLDERGQLITRRGHDSGRQTLLGATCTWAHELYDEHLARATSILYEVEARLDLRRELFSGKLAGVDLDSEARQPWLAAASNDPLLHLSFTSFYSRGDFEISVMATTPCVHDGHRNELELSLLDEAGAPVGSRWMSLSIGSAGVGYNDTSLRLEKRVARLVRSLEIRARSEIRTISRVGPILLDDAEPRRLQS